jgi:hypothetical protein
MFYAIKKSQVLFRSDYLNEDVLGVLPIEEWSKMEFLKIFDKVNEAL